MQLSQKALAWGQLALFPENLLGRRCRHQNLIVELINLRIKLWLVLDVGLIFFLILQNLFDHLKLLVLVLIFSYYLVHACN